MYTLEIPWHEARVLQGRNATRDEVTACAYQAVNLDNKYNGAPIQVRVVMGKEPRHFLAIFKGRLVIFEVIPMKHITLNCFMIWIIYHLQVTNYLFTYTVIEHINKMSSLFWSIIWVCFFFKYVFTCWHVDCLLGRDRSTGCCEPWSWRQTLPDQRNTWDEHQSNRDARPSRLAQHQWRLSAQNSSEHLPVVRQGKYKYMRVPVAQW